MLATLLLSVLMVAAASSQQQLYEGSKCALASKPDVPASCKLISDCPYAQKELKEGRWPELCSFQGNNAIICCPKESKRPATPPRRGSPPRAPVAPVAPVAVAGGLTAREKCAEYSKFVYIEEVSPALLHNVEIVDHCASSSDPLIVGGKEVKPNEFPHMAHIGYDDGEGGIAYQCGGSLISPDFVLTAAHCAINKVDKVARWVLLGEVDHATDDEVLEDPQVIEVDGKPIRHPDYKVWSHYNDIALLRLKTKATMNGFVRPACLHTETDIDRDHATASGWGLTAADGDSSEHLLKVTLTLQPYEACNASYRNYISRNLRDGILDDTMFCAGELAGGKDTCQGDSGGPLQIFTDQKPYYCMHHIVGVTSFGKFCGGPNALGVYTRVSHFVPWIESIVWPRQ